MKKCKRHTFRPFMDQQARTRIICIKCGSEYVTNGIGPLFSAR